MPVLKQLNTPGNKSVKPKPIGVSLNPIPQPSNDHCPENTVLLQQIHSLLLKPTGSHLFFLLKLPICILPVSVLTTFPSQLETSTSLRKYMLSGKNCLKSFPIKRLLIFLPPLLLKWKSRHFSISAQPFCASSPPRSLGPSKGSHSCYSPHPLHQHFSKCDLHSGPEDSQSHSFPRLPPPPSVVSEQHQAKTSESSLILPVLLPYFKSAATACQFFHQNWACDPASFSPV